MCVGSKTAGPEGLCIFILLGFDQFDQSAPKETVLNYLLAGVESLQALTFGCKNSNFSVGFNLCIYLS